MVDRREERRAAAPAGGNDDAQGGEHPEIESKLGGERAPL